MFPNWSRVVQTILNFGDHVYDGASGGASSIREAAERAVDRGVAMARSAQHAAGEFVGRVVGRTVQGLPRINELIRRSYRPLTVDLRQYAPMFRRVWQEGSTFLPPSARLSQGDIQDVAIAAAVGIFLGPFVPAPILTGGLLARGLLAYAENERHIVKRINTNYSKLYPQYAVFRRVAPMCSPRPEETLECR